MVLYDRLCNALLGGKSVSVVAAQHRQSSKMAATLCWLIGLVDSGHCERELKDWEREHPDA